MSFLFKNDIAKLALGHMGSSQTVMSIDTETSTQAKILRQHFDISLATLLEMHAWGFATKISALSLVEENPVENWAYSYRAPGDCLVLRKIGWEGSFVDADTYDDERFPWKEIYDPAGNLIYANLAEAWCEYTRQFSSDEAFPVFFGRALAAQLALDTAPMIITNNFPKVRDSIKAAAEEAITRGISFDLNRKPPPLPSDSMFIRARL